MNRQQTLQMVVALSQGFSKKLEASTIEHYVEALTSDRTTEEQAQKAARQILLEEDRFPTIAKIRSYLRMYAPSQPRALDQHSRPSAENGMMMARASKLAAKLSSIGYGVRWITESGLEEISKPSDGFRFITIDWRDEEGLEQLKASVLAES